MPPTIACPGSPAFLRVARAMAALAIGLGFTACVEPSARAMRGDAGAVDAIAGDAAAGAWVPDAHATIDGSNADTGPEGGPPRPSLEPCGPGTCWETSAALARCSEVTLHEDFITGRYNIHDFRTTLPAGAPTTIRLERTGGTWEPALVVLTSDGEVLSDGSVGLERTGLGVRVGADGRAGAANVTIESATELPVRVLVTGWSVVTTGFVSSLPTSADYLLSIDNVCDGELRVPCVLDDVTPREPACTWIHHVARSVVPELEGDRETRLTNAAIVTWWSLREGVIYLANPFVYSNCNFPSGDAHIGPLESCVPGRAWQVGLSGVQAAYLTLPQTEAIAARVHPDLTIDEVLERAARQAGLHGTELEEVIASTDQLRVSWLLREDATGFTHQITRIVPECLEGTAARWCFSSANPFARDRAQAGRVIDDIRALLDELAP